MKQKRLKTRGDAVTSQFLRQLAVGLITGGVIGLAFMPPGQNQFGIYPVGIGVFLALIGLIQSIEE